MSDQAEALRNMVNVNSSLHRSVGRATKIVTVTSGKGGVGKSNFSLNFALALRKLEKKVLLFDADIGMANIDVLMGITPSYTLYHLLKREKNIREIIQQGPDGVDFIAGGSGFRDLLELSQDQLNYFEAQILKLHGEYDFILFDTGAGLSKETLKFIVASEETIVVTTPEPTAITDAYALIKMVKSEDATVKFKLVVNRANDYQEGRATADKISLVTQRFLGISLPFLGVIQDDTNVSKSVKKQVPFTIAFPTSDASRDVMNLAKQFCEVSTTVLTGRNKGIIRFIHKMFRNS